MIDSASGSKYKNYTILVDNIDNIQNNQFFLLLNCHTEAGQAVNILANFQTQKDTQRWAVCLKFAKMIQSSKKKERLFEKEKKPVLKPERSKKSFGQRSHDSGLVQPTFFQKRQNTNNSDRIRGMPDQNAKALEIVRGKHNPRKQS